MNTRVMQTCLTTIVAAAFFLPAFADGAKIFLGSSGTGAPYEADLVRARQDEGRC